MAYWKKVTGRELVLRTKRGLKGKREGKVRNGRDGNLFGINAGVVFGILAARCNGVS